MALTWRSLLLLVPGVLAILWRPEPSTLWWWWLAAAIVIALDWALAPRPTQLQIVRAGPTPTRVGGTTTTELYVTNLSNRTARGRLRDAWVPSAQATPRDQKVRFPSHERSVITTTLEPVRRGDLPADRVTLRLNGPLGLAARQRSLAVPGTLRALHPFGSLRHLPSRLNLLRQLDGRSAVRVRGQGTEFDSLRDYVQGDDVRSIDWRATARRSDLVVRTWQPEQHRRVVIVIDSSRTSATRVGEFPRLDTSMDAALLLTALAGRAHDNVEVIAGDRVVRARAQGSDRATLLAETIAALSNVSAELVEVDWAMLSREIAAGSNRKGLVVLLTSLNPSAVSETLLPMLPMLTRRHRVVLAAVTDPAEEALLQQRGTVSEVYDAAAAERGNELREAARAMVEAFGVTVVEGDTEQLPPRLADHYLALKAQGLL